MRAAKVRWPTSWASQGSEGLIVRLRDLEAGRSALADAGIASTVGGDVTAGERRGDRGRARLTRRSPSAACSSPKLRPEEVDLETVFLELTRDQGDRRRAGVMTDLVRSGARADLVPTHGQGARDRSRCVGSDGRRHDRRDPVAPSRTSVPAQRQLRRRPASGASPAR